MPGPVLWGPNNISNNLEAGMLLSSGALITQNGPVNYLAGGNFANGTANGFTLGTIGTLTNGIPTGTPTFGSGAAGTLSVSAISSAQSLAGYALSLVSSAATTAGNMLASPALAIATEDQAKVLSFKGYYSVPVGAATANFSGTSSNSFGIAIYDVTNSSWLSSTSNFGMVQSSGVGTFTGTCQTNATTANLRFVVYCNAATTAAVTVNFTDLFLGPQTILTGPSVGDWVQYPIVISATTTAPTKGTTTIDRAEYRRVGDSVVIRYQYLQTSAGTGGSGNYLFSLPAGLVADTTKITPDTGANFSANCGGFWASQNGNEFFTGNAYLYDTTHFGGIGTNGSTTASSGVAPFNPGVITFAAATVAIGFQEVTIPIAGWSSNNIQSSDAALNVVAASVNGTPANVTANNPIIFPTVVYDTNGAYNSVTGQFKAPVSGYYRIATTLLPTGFAANSKVSIYVNASLATTIGFSDANGNAWGAGTVKVKSGDLIDIRPNAAITGLSATATDNTLYIEQVQGPATISATESVNMRYYSSSTTVSGSLTTIVFSTKSFDSHNAYNAGTGVYTAPVSGKYQVNASVAMTGTFVLNSTLDLQVQQTGSNTQISEAKSFSGGAVTQMNTNVGDIFYLLAGDTIKVQTSNSGTAPAIAATSTQNWFSIARVGN